MSTSKDSGLPAAASLSLTDIFAIVTGGVNKLITWANIKAALGYEQVSTLAAAATTNIGAQGTEIVIITGNTTITAFDNVAAGVVRMLRFTGTPLLTYNATSLILPGGVNYQIVAGDVFIFESMGSGNWKCFSYSLMTKTYRLLRIVNIFQGTTTYTPSTLANALYVECIGGGGGGACE